MYTSGMERISRIQGFADYKMLQERFPTPSGGLVESKKDSVVFVEVTFPSEDKDSVWNKKNTKVRFDFSKLSKIYLKLKRGNTEKLQVDEICLSDRRKQLMFTISNIRKREKWWLAVWFERFLNERRQNEQGFYGEGIFIN